MIGPGSGCGMRLCSRTVEARGTSSPDHGRGRGRSVRQSVQVSAGGSLRMVTSMPLAPRGDVRDGVSYGMMASR